MNTRYFDAVVFKPKRNIIFYGFGVFANYNGEDVDLKFKWKIGDDGEHSEEFKQVYADSDKDPDRKWFTIDIRDFGVKPIKVGEGERLHVMAAVNNDNCRRCFYGYCGY